MRATDLEGRDVTETLRRWDRQTVDGFRRRDGWIGYAEEHGIILDFGDRLSGFKPDDRLVLCLAGWVEYPYSQTNYAAATAGVALQPPAIERQRADGTWEMIEPHAGYPAGLPRMTTLDLTGKLTGPRCVLRIRTNMECYYDQAFLAVRDRQAESAFRVKALPVARAVLGPRGYIREVSPDGRQPLIYDYDHVDPAPLARMSGKVTRSGDVASPAPGRRRPVLRRRTGRRGPARVRRPGACLPCRRAGREATCCGPSATARTPTRSRPRATRSSPCPGGTCRRFPLPPVSSGRRPRPSRPISVSTRPGRPEEPIMAAASR